MTETVPRMAAKTPLYDLDALAPVAAKLAGVGFWYLDHVSRTFVWSEEMYRIYGLDPDSPPPDIKTLNSFCHPDDLPRLLEHQRVNSGRDAVIEVRIIRPDGEVRHVTARSAFRSAPDGSGVARIGVLTDVTAMKLAEAEAI
jgi:PAS domain S-box-containing protein